VSAELGRSYLRKARLRLEALDFFLSRGGYSDVVREAQECVELALKAILRHLGVEPPKQHDVGDIVRSMAARLPPEVAAEADRLAGDSKWLRKEREFALCGDLDFVPDEEYSLEDGQQALRAAAAAVGAAERVMGAEPPTEP
jgi:HEPN domain-containing protein